MSDGGTAFSVRHRHRPAGTGGFGFCPPWSVGRLGFNVVEVCLLRLCLRFIAGQQHEGQRAATQLKELRLARVTGEHIIQCHFILDDFALKTTGIVVVSVQLQVVMIVFFAPIDEHGCIMGDKLGIITIFP